MIRIDKRPLGVMDGLPDLDPGQAGCFFTSGGSSQPAGNTTSTNTSAPWSGQTPYLTGGGSTTVAPGTPGANANPNSPSSSGVFNAAANLYQNYTPQYYPNSTVAPLNPTQQVGQSLETAQGLSGSPGVNQANNFLGNEESGGFLSAGNPYWSSMANNVLSQTMPSLESTFTQGNAVNEPGAAYAVSQGANDALGSVMGNQYTTLLQQANQGAMLAPGIQSANLQNTAAIQDAGNQQQAQSQAQLNNQVNQFNYEQMLPYNQLTQYADTVSGNYGGTSTLTQPYYTGSNAATNGLLGGVAGAGLGGLLGGSSGASSGSLLGMLAGMNL